MSWMRYNKETKKTQKVCTLVSDLEKFDSIVMDNETWNEINQFSDNVPWGRESRMNTFVDDLITALAFKEAENNEPLNGQPWNYILHVELNEDKDTAIISIQRRTSYEFVLKNLPIPLKKL